MEDDTWAIEMIARDIKSLAAWGLPSRKEFRAVAAQAAASQNPFAAKLAAKAEWLAEMLDWEATQASQARFSPHPIGWWEAKLASCQVSARRCQALLIAAERRSRGLLGPLTSTTLVRGLIAPAGEQ